MMTLGERIKTLRKKRGLTQEELAKSLFVTFQAVSKWECNLSHPDITLIAPLTKILNVSADVLLGLDELEEDDTDKNQFNQITADGS